MGKGRPGREADVGAASLIFLLSSAGLTTHGTGALLLWGPRIESLVR